ncbi:hypothetical protein EJ04DRAFT_562408 [Polyplosphaeria fusca]|uniref:HypA n=1 Tax=Polyplosphaeria fusca TaxID=682080 RepID=A0A9P4R1S7_9PLEO|nr:hypothetical protein EJ04DRAFT_562408 [Polyplosphaeria fusca]
MSSDRVIEEGVGKATSYSIFLSPERSSGYTHVAGLKQENADKASELLMLNHAKYHTLFDEVGFHNHIVHHLLTIWALGASPLEIQRAYDRNQHYQLPHYHHDPSVALEMKDEDFFKECLGKTKYYSNYLQFFQEEIQQKGVGAVVNEMFSGFEHPILQLGFALEFNQPCLVAEALAAACIHDDWPLSIVLPIEGYIASQPNLPSNTYTSVLDALRSDPTIKTSVHPSDPQNRVTDALMQRASTHFFHHASKWRVHPTNPSIAHRTAEMIHMCAYVSGAAQNPKKLPAFDFFTMHSTNLSIFFSTFAKLDWLSLESKARLLTWKGWMDFAIYAAAGCPELYHGRITQFRAKAPGGWEGVVERARRYGDDGHTAKFVRALLNAEGVSGAYFGRAEFPLEEGEFLKIAHMVMDSVERMDGPGWELPGKIRREYVEEMGEDEEVARLVARWVRWGGMEDAWEGFPDLEETVKL